LRERFSLEDVFEVEKSDEILLFSIQPRFSEMIRAGTKKVELRKRKPKIVSDFAIIYESSPKKSVSFLIKIKKIDCAPKKAIWERYRTKCGISKESFYDYYKGSKESVAILIDSIMPLDYTIPRKILSLYGLTPPQDYRYAPKEMVMEILGR